MFTGLIRIVFGVLFLGDKLEKSTDKETRLLMSHLSSLCIYVLFSFHWEDKGKWFDHLNRINIYLPLLIVFLIFGVLFLVLHFIFRKMPAMLSVITGVCLVTWIIIEIAYRYNI